MSIQSDLSRSQRRLGRVLAVVAVMLATALPSIAGPIFADTASAPEGVGRDNAQLIDLGTSSSCAIVAADVLCWGNNGNAELGLGNSDVIGDDESPSPLGKVDLGAGVTAKALSSGSVHTCVLLTAGSVKCWGDGGFGRLGYVNLNSIGDDETPASVGTVDIGGTATMIATGSTHSCVLLTAGSIRCWGSNYAGELGYRNTNPIGDNETPASAGNVDFGGTATAVTGGGNFTCVLLTGGFVKCWGENGNGQLGQRDAFNIGDDEFPSAIGNIDLGGTATAISSGLSHTCALMSTGAVRCWGDGRAAQLGYGNLDIIGDDETPASAGDVPLGGTAIAVAAGDYHTCAILTGGAVRCWGDGFNGRLGYGNQNSIGDDETPASAGDVPIGGTAVAMAGGHNHTCVILSNKTVKCWGLGNLGQLGYGNTNNIGDNEAPSTVGAVSLGGEVAPPTTTTTTSTSTTTTTTIPMTTTTTSVPKVTKLKSVRRGSRTAVTRLISLPKGKRSYAISGGCRLNAARTVVTAPKKKATCRLTVKGRSGSKTTTAKATFKVT